jgi:hypothetical protein
VLGTKDYLKNFKRYNIDNEFYEFGRVDEAARNAQKT